MPLKVGSNDTNTGGVVTRWQHVMVARFRSYAKAADGGPLKEDGYFGNDDADVQREYERRTLQNVDGIVSDDDLKALGLPVPTSTLPWHFTVHGTAQPDPLGPGLPADTARACLDASRWQPIGNYPARAFPNMWDSIMQGVAELVLQIDQKLRNDTADFWMSGYSQGACVVAYVLKYEIMHPTGRLAKYRPQLKKVVFWGNPMRQKGVATFDEWIWPIAPEDSHGIMAWDLLEGLDDPNLGFQVRDYAHAADMYACNRDSDKDEYKRAICKIIMHATDWVNGPDSVFSQLGELVKDPIAEGVSLTEAIVDAIKFFTSTAHGYNIYPAIAFLRG